ncbi:MAG: dTMP kinase [Deferrisomatales bacterium]|nr:dTMP kinase [Deferrisomatales bacterium]
MAGVFLTLEGGEGTGKTTQLDLLAKQLRALGRNVLLTREPGGTALGARLRELLVRHSDDPPVPISELLLYAADRAHHVATVVRPALEAGAVVLCDRYADATLAYQGYGRGLDLEAVVTLNGLATGGLWPHRTVLLDLPPEQGVRRSLERQAGSHGPREERFEAEALGFHRRVRDGYRAIAAAEPERVRVVLAHGNPAQVAARVWAAVSDLFPAVAS